MASGYGQFCAVARADEVLGGRWTLLVIRELLSGSRRFSDIRRGIPRISRSVLAARLRALESLGALRRIEAATGPEYELTEAGRDIAPIVASMATWGQSWLPRRTEEEDLDLEPLLVDMARRTRPDSLPKEPVVIRVRMKGAGTMFLLLKSGECAACEMNPGFPEALSVGGSLAALTAWWRGDRTLAEARRDGLQLEGSSAMVRAFPGWFARYAFADVEPRSTVGNGGS